MLRGRNDIHTDRSHEPSVLYGWIGNSLPFDHRVRAVDHEATEDDRHGTACRGYGRLCRNEDSVVLVDAHRQWTGVLVNADYSRTHRRRDFERDSARRRFGIRGESWCHRHRGQGRCGRVGDDISYRERLRSPETMALRVVMSHGGSEYFGLHQHAHRFFLDGSGHNPQCILARRPPALVCGWPPNRSGGRRWAFDGFRFSLLRPRAQPRVSRHHRHHDIGRELHHS